MQPVGTGYCIDGWFTIRYEPQVAAIAAVAQQNMEDYKARLATRHCHARTQSNADRQTIQQAADDWGKTSQQVLPWMDDVAGLGRLKPQHLR
jgi:hypothetical protein